MSSFQVVMFHSAWEIYTNVTVDRRLVCRGPYPNDLESMPDLMDRLNRAPRAKSDQEVKTIMGDWAK